MTKEEETKENLRKVGKLVQDQRKALGLSVAAFAKKSELTPVTVYSVEAGKSKFHRKTADKLVSTLLLTDEQKSMIQEIGNAVNYHTKKIKQEAPQDTPSAGAAAAD